MNSVEEPSMRDSNWVEGIGDELVYAIAAFFALLIAMFYIVTNREWRQVSIHPDSVANVQSAREIRQQERQHSSSEHVNPTITTRHTNQGDQTCPICLNPAEYAVETNCGHLFCGSCLNAYWRHGNWLGAVRCPVCRTQVSIMLRNFSPSEQINMNSPERQHIEEQINQYNRRFSGEPVPWSDYIRDLPTLFRYAMSEFFSVGGLIWMFRFRIIMCFIAAFLYFISPLDIIPEAVFGILGFIDDLFILLLLAIYITIIYRNSVQNRARATNNNNNQ
ncbi:hypothetical protein CHS0354_024940 [Potamilus streckersoni]|uniref:E3 ubiquitin-protein ligase RNF170 n=1 Tax=Potamilus streckersoni TaxID=2493646 RepID=A0AAE0S4Y0_9BIVA|nr:hypothetical protein CHS0354_024940 [Potamilus streckersoni]